MVLRCTVFSWNQNPRISRPCCNRVPGFLKVKQKFLQQGLEIRGFWFQKKTVQRKTVLREVYTYVLNEIFFQKTVYLQGFCSKSVLCEVTPLY